MGPLTQQSPLPGRAGEAWGAEELAAQWPGLTLPGNCHIDPNPNLQKGPPKINALHSPSNTESLKATVFCLRAC